MIEAVIFASNLINIFSPSFVRGSAIGSMRRHIGFIDPIYRQRKYRDNSPNSKSSTPLPISKESKRMMFRPETKKSGGMEITKPLLNQSSWFSKIKVTYYWYSNCHCIKRDIGGIYIGSSKGWGFIKSSLVPSPKWWKSSSMIICSAKDNGMNDINKTKITITMAFIEPLLPKSIFSHLGKLDHKKGQAHVLLVGMRPTATRRHLPFDTRSTSPQASDCEVAPHTASHPTQWRPSDTPESGTIRNRQWTAGTHRQSSPT